MRIDLLTLHQDEGLEIALDDYGKVTIRWDSKGVPYVFVDSHYGLYPDTSEDVWRRSICFNRRPGK
jgi:hypothetical protein